MILRLLFYLQSARYSTALARRWGTRLKCPPGSFRNTTRAVRSAMRFTSIVFSSTEAIIGSGEFFSLPPRLRNTSP